MFKELWDNIIGFEQQHQVLFAAIVALGIIFFSWGSERILEEYILKEKKLSNYIIAIVSGLLLLFLTKNILLRVM